MNLNKEQINKIEEAIGIAAVKSEWCYKENYESICDYIHERLSEDLAFDGAYFSELPVEMFDPIMTYLTTRQFNYYGNWCGSVDVSRD